MLRENLISTCYENLEALMETTGMPLEQSNGQRTLGPVPGVDRPPKGTNAH